VLRVPTQLKDDKVQFAVTLTWATTKAEKKKNKDMSGGATESIRRHISYPKAKGADGGRV
jgi:hypothetical protein